MLSNQVPFPLSQILPFLLQLSQPPHLAPLTLTQVRACQSLPSLHCSTAPWSLLLLIASKHLPLTLFFQAL